MKRLILLTLFVISTLLLSGCTTKEYRDCAWNCINKPCENITDRYETFLKCTDNARLPDICQIKCDYLNYNYTNTTKTNIGFIIGDDKR